MNTKKTAFLVLLFFIFSLTLPLLAKAQTASDFNPNFIISDEEMQSTGNWTTGDIQQFLQSKGSYLASLIVPDATGIIKTAAEIIYDAAISYQINPKYLLVTLQKEQSLITDDTPTQKQLDWATGYGICDSCSMNDPKVIKFKGFGKQVDDAAGIIRWYYNNSNTNSIVKKKDQPISIDSQSVVPQSWATAFLYTYTPHLHGNENFWRIWSTWFSQIYPNGSLLQSIDTGDVWLIQNGIKKKFINQAVLLTMADPKMIITVPDVELNNYQNGPDISFPVYSILQSPSGIYLLDYDTLRPFASAQVVRDIGYNPDEITQVTDADLVGYPIGSVISSSSTPQSVMGVIYQITDLNNAYYLFKDNKLYPITDKSIIQTNYKDLAVEKHLKKDINSLEVADVPVTFKDGTLFKAFGSSIIYVMEGGKKRRIADDDTFNAIGYKKSNVITVSANTPANILNGEPIFLNASLLSSKNKYLGDNAGLVSDLYKSKLPSYLVAEYPSGRIISGKNIDKQVPVTSLAKLLVAYEALDQNFDMTKTKNINLFKTLINNSSDNAVKSVIDKTGLKEDEFTSAIHETLANWGSDETVINNLTGASQNKSTARNLLKIFTKVLENNNIKSALSANKYPLSKNYKVLASTTGYSSQSGVISILLIESKKTKKQYSIITLGDKNFNNRFAEPIGLAKWISTGNVKIANY